MCLTPTGKIIVIAYPDTYVRHSEEWVSKFLPYLGLGNKHYIKAGHAAQILINNENGAASYFDFGRYITPLGKGRVRSAKTDAELHLPIKASIENNVLKNLDQFLIWLDSNPQKTHGSGRLLASVCNEIDFELAYSYINNLQSEGSIPYGAFNKIGSNCSRFVTDTIINSTYNPKIKEVLKRNKKFTPSTVGNVEKASSDKNVYEVFKGKISIYKGSALKENLHNYFDKKEIKKVHQNYHHYPNGTISIKNLHKLEGIGSSAYFQFIEENTLPKYHFRIKRLNDGLEVDFDGVYFSEEFNFKDSFEVTYDSHCEFVTVLQHKNILKLKVVSSFSLWKKVHLT